MGDFRKKKYPADWFRGEKNLARKYMTLHVGEKNFITRGLEEINLSYTNQITNTSPSPFKSQMVGPLAMELNANCNTTVFLELCSFNCYACSAVWTIDCIKRRVWRLIPSWWYLRWTGGPHFRYFKIVITWSWTREGGEGIVFFLYFLFWSCSLSRFV